MSDETALRRHWRRVWRITAGSVVILVGILLCFLPGPGVLTIVAGLAIMADEVSWARKIMDKLKERLRQADQKVRGKSTESSSSEDDPPVITK